MKLHLLNFKNIFIYDQLRLEEALLRTSDKNFCILNTGSPKAVVTSSSSNVHDWVEVDAAENAQVPIVRRFSAGGTVVIDPNTIFVTFIIQKRDLEIEPYPESVLKWANGLFQKALPMDIDLQENDFVIGEKKIGGNALYFRKDAWLLHTSFLWDYQDHMMDLLKHPIREPEYRKGRSHDEFLSKLSWRISKELFLQHIQGALKHQFDLNPTSVPRAFPEHRKSVEMLNSV